MLGWEVLPHPLYSANPWKIRMLGWEVLPHPLYSTNPWKDKNVRMGGSSKSFILKKIRMLGWEVLPIHEKIRMLGWEVLPNPLYSTNPWKDKNVRMGGSSKSFILKKFMKR